MRRICRIILAAPRLCLLILGFLQSVSIKNCRGACMLKGVTQPKKESNKNVAAPKSYE